MELILKNLLSLQERGKLHKYASIAHHRAWLESKMSHPSFCPGGRQSNATCQLNCHPPHHARPDCCSEDCPCDEGEGHCHRDADCVIGLFCGSCKNITGSGYCCQSGDAQLHSNKSDAVFPCAKCGVMGHQIKPKIFGGIKVTVSTLV